MKNLLVLLCISVSLTQGVKLPSNFKKCNRKQPDLDECVLEAAQQGLAQLNKPYKKLNTPSLEPLRVTELTLHSNFSLVALNEKLRDCEFYGFTNALFEKFKWDLERKTLDARVLFHSIKTSCHYNIDGRILGQRVYGDGPSYLDFEKFNLTFHVTYDEVKKNQKTYVKVTSVHVEGRPANVHFQLDNLFGGDKEASDRTNQVLNDAWSDLYDDVSEEYLKAADSLVSQLLQRFFTRLSIEEAFD